MHSHFEKALIIKAVPYSDKDMIVHLLGEGSGKLAVFARGCRGSKKRFPGGVDPTTFVKVELKKGKGNLPSLLGTENLFHLNNLNSSLNRISASFLLCECIDLLVAEHQVVDGLFASAVNSMIELDDKAKTPLASLQNGLKDLLRITGFLNPTESLSLEKLIQRIEYTAGRGLNSKETVLKSLSS